MKANALVLAGAANGGRLKDSSPVAYEALIPVGGKPLLQYVLDALSTARGVGETVVVGPRAELEGRVSGREVRFLEGAGSLLDNVWRGVNALPGDRAVLIVSSDVPLISGAVIDEFLALCAGREADFYYPIIERKTSEGKYPGAKRTYVRIRGAAFTGGNMVLLEPFVLERCLEKARAFVANRKSPFRLVQLLGWSFVIRLLFRRLTVPQLEEKISGLFGIRAVAVPCSHPEIGMDVDKPEDLRLVEAILARQVVLGRVPPGG